MTFIKSIILVISFTLLITSCTPSQKKSSVEESPFGELSDGRPVTLYTLTNSSSSEVRIINYGAAVTNLFVEDKEGKTEDVVLGFDNIEDYVNKSPYFGAIVGRYGNRIDDGKFELDGNEYQLDINDGKNHLHGGSKGFDKVLWEAEPVKTQAGTAVKLTYVSPDGEMGYPGTLTLTVTYTLTDSNELKIDYDATTDKPTILNPTHHSYFNLTGNFSQKILDHKLMIDADKFTPVDSTLIPTGELRDVEGTPMDFRTPKKIGEDINDDYKQLRYGKGYDHNWALNNYDGTVRKVATLYSDTSGIFMEVLTDQPGLQFYSGNFLDGSITGKNGIKYQHRTGLCLEAQHFPDSPNHPEFPSTVLRPGETYHQTTIYRFSVK